MQPSLSFIKQILSFTVLLFLTAGQLFSQSNYQKLGEWQMDRTDSVSQYFSDYYSERNNISLIGRYFSPGTIGSMNIVYPPSCNGSSDFFVLNLDTNMTFKNCLRYGGKNPVTPFFSNFTKWKNDTIVIVGLAEFFPDTACEMQSLPHGDVRDIWVVVSDTIGNVLNERLIGTAYPDYSGWDGVFLDTVFTMSVFIPAPFAGDDLWNLPPPCVNCPSNSTMINLSTFNYGLQKIGEKYVGPAFVHTNYFIRDSINHFIYMISRVNTTQPNTMDVTQAGTGIDIWILKMDEQLNILSDHRIITLFDEQTFKTLPSFLPNGNILIWGATTSYFGAGLQGTPQGGQDLFLYEVDTAGNLVNDRCYGTTINDDVNGVSLLKNGMFMVSIYTLAGISGNKTEPSRGAGDAWFLFLDASLNIVYQKTLGGSNNDRPAGAGAAAIHEWADGSVLVILESASDSSGDKTIPSNPNPILDDLWLVRFMPGLLTGIDEVASVPTVPFVFPNPATDEFEIRIPNIRSYSVYQLDGRLITQGNVKNEEAITVSCAKWNQGVYLVEVIKSNGSRMVNKVVKQ